MNNNQEKSVRDKYFANEIFKIGDIVEDTLTKKSMQVIDRGSNYITVASEDGITKKWLNEVLEPAIQIIDNEFTITESGQIKLFGYETKNFDSIMSEFILEQFNEFTDLYSKHQIIKCLDLALQETNVERAYTLAEKVELFYAKNNIEPTLITEVIKSEIERTRIVEILAAIADITPSKSKYDTIRESINALRSKYKQRSQWEIIYPFFKVAESYGLTGIIQKLPFDFNNIKEEEIQDNIILMTLEENIDLLVDELDIDDITEAFIDEEDSDELLTEVLSIETRQKLSRKLRQRSPILTVKRERAMTKAVSTSVLLGRARKLAETILKSRIFHKPVSDLSRQEKERFESGASKRRALVSRLAQRLLPKVRELQSQRLHHEHKPASHMQNKVVAVAPTTALNGKGAS